MTAKVHVLVVSRLDKDSLCQTESDQNGHRETGLDRKTGSERIMVDRVTKVGQRVTKDGQGVTKD